MNKLIYTIFLFVLPFSVINSQKAETEKFVQVSGFVTDKSNQPVSGVAIISMKLHKGTLSEMSGIYSIASIPGDTILFRALGYKKYHTIIPPTYQDQELQC